jgi:hypothetical protein
MPTVSPARTAKSVGWSLRPHCGGHSLLKFAGDRRSPVPIILLRPGEQADDERHEQEQHETMTGMS